MKILNKLLGIALLAFLFTSCASSRIMAQQEGEYISDQQFYDELQPYGTWIYDQQYGNVWIPDVEEDFKPYATRGYWAMTDAGNTWVSDYPWGWAAFHYGRWHFDNYYGWEWSPGSEWAPAWVNWRDGGGYYGWAPMEPNINYDNGSYYDDNNYAINDNYWVFAPYAYINYPNVYNYYVPHNRVSVIIRNTNWVRNRYTYNNHSYYSPRREDIQRYSGRPVRVYNITNVNRPSRTTVNNNNINVYRPGVRTNANARPGRVVDGAAYREQNPAQRIGGSGGTRGTRYNPANAAKLAEAARTNNPDGKIVRVNNNNANVDGRPQRGNPVNTTRPTAPQGNVNPTDNNGARPSRGTRPAQNGDVQQQRNVDRQQSDAQQQQMRQQQQTREQQRQVRDQQRNQQQQATQQQTDQQKQVADQQRQQQQQAREQQRQQREQQRQQQMSSGTQQANDDARVQQQREQARQQQEQQRQQQAQQQQQQVRQQQEQQTRQQQEQARQQQAQQQQQARDQARQQQEQQRQQQQQAREQARQQQDQQRQQQQEQARQQQDQQRQQQQEQARQQRQQQEQQRQQQQPRETSGGRPARN